MSGLVRAGGAARRERAGLRLLDREPSSDRRGSRRTRLLVRIALALLGGLLLPELAVRFLLLSERPLAQRLGASLRRADLFAEPQSREHWALKARFRKLTRAFLPHLDPVLGYRSDAIAPLTLRHVDEGTLQGRRPVLLYGDSFARCETVADECWQGWLERSDLAERYALLNYGVGGYGLDQSVLLLEGTLALYRDLDPVVIVSLLIDDDLDRCYLVTRGHPKPHFEIEDDQLVLHPPPPLSGAGFVQAPIEIRSYLWNLFLYGSGVVSEEQRERWLPASGREALVRDLAARLIRRAHADLAGVEHFFLLFHARPSAETRGPFTWREELLYETLEREGIPFVSSKRALWEAARREGRSLASYYIPATAQRGKNHYNADGNRVVFEALRAGLERRYEPPGYLAGAAPPADTRATPRERLH